MRSMFSIVIVSSFILISGWAQGANLVAHYSFDDPNHLGLDDSGNGYDLVPFNNPPDYVSSGKEGGAAVFNGATHGYQSRKNIFPKGSFSFALWVKPDAITPSVITAHSLSSGFGVTMIPSEFRFWTYHDSGKKGSSWLRGYITPVLGQWQHLTMVFEAKVGPDETTGNYTGTLKAYYNGILSAVMTNAQYDAESSNCLDIGHRSNHYFKGVLDDIRIYSSALTADEVRALIADPADVKLGSYAEIIPVAQTNIDWWMERHQAVLDRIREGNVDLIMIGDSITHLWEDFKERPNGKAVWEKYYAHRNAVNLGFCGDRTQQVLWRMQNGEIDGINPKLAVLLIGTNNSKLPSQAPELIADGVGAIVHEIRSRLPQTKILLLGIFPRGAPEQNKMSEAGYNWLWERIDQINEFIAGLADQDMVYYLNINDKFLNSRGNLTREIAPDLLHPNEKGYEIWAAAMEPIIKQFVEEK